ncbi:MAG: UvrB/UvrC motif-containing protein [Flavobacteriales bacterium]|nr:UvrB/UvrC motif-containing protein [Flavobacteriales bacterium]
MTEKELIEKIKQLEKEKKLEVENQNYPAAANKRDLITKYTKQLQELKATNGK